MDWSCISCLCNDSWLVLVPTCVFELFLHLLMYVAELVAARDAIEINVICFRIISSLTVVVSKGSHITPSYRRERITSYYVTTLLLTLFRDSVCDVGVLTRERLELLGSLCHLLSIW